MSDHFQIPKECRLFTAEQSRAADRQTIEEFGIDGITLMELAAAGAANQIHGEQGNRKAGLFVCGKGNNAGDALAVARYLANDAGHSVSIYPVFGLKNLSADTAKNLQLLQTLGKNGADVKWIENLDSVDFLSYNYIVDGIFGTGLNSLPREHLPKIVIKLNESGLQIYSMDVPSGLNSDSGEAPGECIKAGTTFTFGTNKTGLYLNRAFQYSGEVNFVNLPFPSYFLDKYDALINQVLYENLPKSNHTPKHKYDGGVVHIVAGSEGLTGAAIMAAKSAWKRGAGAVFLYAPKALLHVYEVVLPQIIKIAVGENADLFFRQNHTGTILKSLHNKKGTLLIGPGVGTRTETGNFITRLLEKYDGNAIIDADALLTWKHLKSLPAEKKKNWLLTPHEGEAKKYLNAEFTKDFEKLGWVKEFTNQQLCSVFLKGNPAFFAQPKSPVFISGYDTSIFNRAGFGDVLGGAIAAGASIENNRTIGTIRALYETYLALTASKNKSSTGPENLL